MNTSKGANGKAGNGKGSKASKASKFVGRDCDRPAWEKSQVAKQQARKEKVNSKKQNPDHNWVKATVMKFLSIYPNGILSKMSTKELNEALHSMRPTDLSDRGFATGGPVFIEACIMQIDILVRKNKAAAARQRKHDMAEARENGLLWLVKIAEGTKFSGRTYSKYRNGPRFALVLSEDFDPETMTKIELDLVNAESMDWTVAVSKVDDQNIPASGKYLVDFLANANGGKPSPDYRDVGNRTFWSVRMSPYATAVLIAIYGSNGGKVIKPTPKPYVAPVAAKHLKQIRSGNSFSVLNDLEEESDSAPASAPAPIRVEEEPVEEFPSLGKSPVAKSSVTWGPSKANWSKESDISSDWVEVDKIPANTAVDDISSGWEVVYGDDW